MQGCWDEYKELYKNRVQKPCKYCGKIMEIIPSDKREFCDKNCFNEYLKLEHDKNIDNYDYHCKICNAKISPQNGRLYEREFCSRECYSVYLSQIHTNKVHVNCGYCGKDLEVIPSKVDKREKIYCDVKCMAKDYSARFSGENSPTWTGGKRHYTGGWLNARNEIREIDECTCQICGITENELGKQMDVHHIQKYKDFDDKFKANELSNLVCLCWRCHMFVHSNSNYDNIYIK